MEQLEAGRELDALVAEKVMGEAEPVYVPGWNQVFTATFNGDALWSEKGNWYWICDGNKDDGVFCYPRPFSKDIAAAWQIVEKMAENDISLHLAEVVPSSDAIVWEVMFSGRDISDTYTCEMSVPFAICLAALKAVGVDYGTSRTEKNS